MEPDVSLPHSQDHSTCPSPEPDQTNPSPIPLLDNPFQHSLPINALDFLMDSFPQVLPPKPSLVLSCSPTCQMPYPSPFPSFGKLNNIQWRVQVIHLLTNQHLLVVLPVCALTETTCTYHAHCTTGSTLPLAMSTQSLGRAADGNEVCRSVVSVIFGWID